MRKGTKSPAERFWGKVEFSFESGACWIWKGAFSGYTGRFWDRRRGKLIAAHRFAYEYTRGVYLRPCDRVLHTCGNSRCLRPEHLRLAKKSAEQANEFPKLRFQSKPIRVAGCRVFRRREYGFTPRYASL